jgi:hypothetical protein
MVNPFLGAESPRVNLYLVLLGLGLNRQDILDMYIKEERFDELKEWIKEYPSHKDYILIKLYEQNNKKAE